MVSMKYDNTNKLGKKSYVTQKKTDNPSLCYVGRVHVTPRYWAKVHASLGVRYGKNEGHFPIDSKHT